MNKQNNNSTTSVIAKRRKIEKNVDKTVYAKNDVVFAAYWQEHDVNRELEPSFYPGLIVTSHVTNDNRVCREYSVVFDDGFILNNIPESMVFLTEGYNLRMKYDSDKHLPWLGDVIFETDENSFDDWYKYTGWYSIVINGEHIHYSLLLYAPLAYDKNELDKHCGTECIISKLNLPKYHPSEGKKNAKTTMTLTSIFLPPPTIFTQS